MFSLAEAAVVAALIVHYGLAIDKIAFTWKFMCMENVKSPPPVDTVFRFPVVRSGRKRSLVVAASPSARILSSRINPAI
jgi:hypothetical protein